MKVTITVNGVERALDIEPRWLLADVLRDGLGLTGTKIGCAHGVCGSCTVNVGGMAVRSCLMLAAQAAGKSVRTVEGLACDGEQHPLQQAFADHGGLQCGFCTPGMLMTAAAVVERCGPLTPEAARVAMSGNICRCTGYDGIVAAVVEASTGGGAQANAEVGIKAGTEATPGQRNERNGQQAEQGAGNE